MDKVDDEHERAIADFKKDFPEAFPKVQNNTNAGGAAGRANDGGGGGGSGSSVGAGTGAGASAGADDQQQPSILYDLAATEAAKVPDGYGVFFREKDRAEKAPERGRPESAPKRRRIADILNEDSTKILNTLLATGGVVGGAAAVLRPAGGGGNAAGSRQRADLLDATVDEYLIRKPAPAYAPLVMKEDAAIAMAAGAGAGAETIQPGAGAADASSSGAVAPLQMIPLNQSCFSACSANLASFSNNVLRSPEVKRVLPPRHQIAFINKNGNAIGHVLRHFWKCFENGHWTPPHEKVNKAIKTGACLESLQQKDQMRSQLAPEFRSCVSNIIERVDCAVEKKRKFDTKRAKKGV